MGTVKTDTFEMEYCSFGHGKKIFVILPGLSLQSVMLSAGLIEEAYREMEEDCTLIVFDRRKELPEAYSISEMAKDTADAIRALGYEKVNVFGASQGGMIAMEIALQDPDLVEKLILGSTSAIVTGERAGLIREWIRLAEEGKAKDLCFAFAEAVYPKEVFEQSQELLLQMADAVTKEDMDRFVILARSLDGFDIADRVPDIACPVLVLGDRDDRVLGPEGVENIAKSLGGRADCELLMYEGFGHAAYDLAPDYKQRMLHFLQ